MQNSKPCYWQDILELLGIHLDLKDLISEVYWISPDRWLSSSEHKVEPWPCYPNQLTYSHLKVKIDVVNQSKFQISLKNMVPDAAILS